MRWVLGEQSTRALRCSKMEDIIFSGTPQRKAQGFCEVTVTMDNTDRELNYDGDTVSVTRRFYRSGESEYRINKTLVRLRDVHELFMDTGLGRDGYSIIGQGKIDSIVSAKSEDRREIFEEAAGISKYRYRKNEAERRLNAAEDHPLMRRALDNRLPVIACVGRELAATMRADVCRTWDEWDDLRECQCVVTEEQETATILLGVSDCVCVVPEQEQAAWAAGVLRQDEDMQRAAMLRRQVTPVPLLKQLGQEVRHRARQMEDAQASAAWSASRVKELEEERRQMRASSSWRVTAPLRMASAGLQRLRKGAQTSRRK